MFFEYHQNNSGGKWKNTGLLTSLVIIEANSNQEADLIAEDLGIYFDGCENGQDCSCCGDRWSRAYGSGDSVPSIYGEPLEHCTFSYSQPIRVFYLSGLVESWVEVDGKMVSSIENEVLPKLG